MRFQDMLVSWQALKMTFAVIPGICLIIWAGYIGWAAKHPSVRDLAGIWMEVEAAKSEGLKEFTRCFLPMCPLLGYVILIVILFLIPYDTVLLAVVNLSALPAALISYIEGSKAGRFRRKGQDWHSFDLSWPALLKVLGLWVAIAGCALAAMRAVNLWKPS